mmetsp:Transcript_29443/g.61429  ORF Transcript_29443/g.61429 Transcript_29443/m.61429 type:complete len:223 (-) Transcript_29443:1009-1677(-)
MAEREGYPRDGHVVGGTPYADDAVEDGGLHLEGSRGRGGELGAKVRNVPLDGEGERGFQNCGGCGGDGDDRADLHGHLRGRDARGSIGRIGRGGRGHFRLTVYLREVFSECHEVRMHGEYDEAFGEVRQKASGVSLCVCLSVRSGARSPRTLDAPSIVLFQSDLVAFPHGQTSPVHLLTRLARRDEVVNLGHAIRIAAIGTIGTNDRYLARRKAKCGDALLQ